MPKNESAFGGSKTYREMAQEGKLLGTKPDHETIRYLLKNMLGPEVVDAQRAAAIIFHCGDTNPKIFEDFVPEMAAVLEKQLHPSGPRTIFRILENKLRITEEYQGIILDLAFQYLQNSKSPIAVKVFAMGYIADQVANYPELKYELASTLSAQMEMGSAGFRSRARKIAKRLGFEL